MYNPDGTELNIRQTVLQDGTERRIDLNRDWAPTAFVAAESVALYTYWTQVKPAFGLDIHHQGLKRDTDGDVVTMSLGIPPAPSGPTLPTVLGGLYDRQTRQAQGLVYTSLQRYGFVEVDRYQVGTYEIDIKGGARPAPRPSCSVSTGATSTRPGHSHPMVFFETSGNTSPGSIGQKARGKAIRQNVIGASEPSQGLATESVWSTDRMIWHEEIPHVDYTADFGDNNAIITPWPTRPPL